MDTTKKNKLFYIGISTILFLLLCIIIGVSRYGKPPEGEDNTSSVTNGEEGKLTSSLDTQTQPLSLSATSVGHIGNACLLGIFCWLSSDVLLNSDDDSLTFRPSRVQLGLVKCMLVVVVGYIGYFAYQKYRQIPAYSSRKDIVIFALATFLTRKVFASDDITLVLEKAAETITNSVQQDVWFKYFQDRIHKSYPDIGRVLRQIMTNAKVKLLVTHCASSVVLDFLAILGISIFKSNGALEICFFDPAGDSMGLFSAVVLSSIGAIMSLSREYHIVIYLLSVIPFCFLYVKYPQVFSSGSEKIDRMIPILFHSSNLWEWFGCVLMVCYVGGVSVYKIIKIWLVLAVCKYALYHLPIKKKDYTASFPLTFTVLFEGACIGGGLWGLFPGADKLDKILCGALLLALALWIKTHFIDDKRPMVQWAGHLTIGLLSIGSSVAAGYCARQNDNNQTLRIIAFWSCLVCSLYLLPKSFNRIVTASLAVADIPPSWQKIARPIQGFTACWLQPNLGVVCTAAVMGAGFIYQLRYERYYWKTLLALSAYFVIEVARYNFPTHTEKLGVLMHGIFSLLFAFAASSEFLNQDNKIKWGLGSLLCYIVVGLWVELLLDVVVQKDYTSVSLPMLDGSARSSKFIGYSFLSAWVGLLIHNDAPKLMYFTLVVLIFGGWFVNYVLQMGYKFPSIDLSPALTFIKQDALFGLSFVSVLYYYLRGEKTILLTIIASLVGLLYILPKCVQLALTISLSWTGMPSSLQKILRPIQGFTDCWLQPNLRVLCTTIVMGAGFIYQFGWKINIEVYISVLVLALPVYFIIEFLRYNFPTYTEILGYVADCIFGLAFSAMFAFSSHDDIEWFGGGLFLYCLIGSLIHYIISVDPYTCLPNLEDRLNAIYTYLYQSCLGILASLQGLFFTAGTPSASPTDVEAELTDMQTDPLHENIKITLVKNFPALFGIAMIVWCKYVPDSWRAPHYSLEVTVLVCAFTVLYANMVLSEFDKGIAKRILATELVVGLFFVCDIHLCQWLHAQQARDGLIEISVCIFTLMLLFVILSMHMDLFAKKALSQWHEQLRGLTSLTCLAALHMAYLYCTSSLPSNDPSALVSNGIIHFCSSFIVWVSVFDTLQLSSAATKDTLKGRFISYCCTYWPGILYISYAIGHIWQIPALSHYTQKIAFSLLFLLLLTGLKQRKVAAQEGGQLRLSPIAIDHNLLAKDLFIAFLLPFVYYTTNQDHLRSVMEEKVFPIKDTDIAMSVLCTIIVRWGLCTGLITHLTKKPTERRSKPTHRTPSSNLALWMRRVLHGILVSTCWLFMKENTITNITPLSWLSFTCVATGAFVFLLGYLSPLCDGVKTKYRGVDIMHYLVLVVLYALAIVNAEGSVLGRLLLCLIAVVLIRFLVASLCKNHTLWRGWQDYTALIQEFCVYIIALIVLSMYFGLEIDLARIQHPFSLVLMGSLLTLLCEVCTLWMIKQQIPLDGLFRWTRADALVDYVPFTSRNEYK